MTNRKLHPLLQCWSHRTWSSMPRGGHQHRPPKILEAAASFSLCLDGNNFSSTETSESECHLHSSTAFSLSLPSALSIHPWPICLVKQPSLTQGPRPEKHRQQQDLEWLQWRRNSQSPLEHCCQVLVGLWRWAWELVIYNYSSSEKALQVSNIFLKNNILNWLSLRTLALYVNTEIKINTHMKSHYKSLYFEILID